MGLTVLQLSDIHLFADPQQCLHEQLVEQNLQEMIAHIQQYETIDMILLTGDLTDQGSALAYQRLVDYFSPLAATIVALPGNHDHLETFNTEFAGTTIMTTGSQIIGGWHIIGLNSVIAGHCEGRLSDDELDFLQHNLLKHSDLPTVIALHHHVLPVNGAMDSIMLTNPNAFLEIIRPHSQVQCVLSGHVHQEFSVIQNNVQFLTVPATSYQMKVNNDTFSDDCSLRPGYRWLKLNDDGKVETLIKRI